MAGVWERIKKFAIGPHEVTLCGRTVDGRDQFRVELNSREQLRGTREDCEREYRFWVRTVKKIQA